MNNTTLINIGITAERVREMTASMMPNPSAGYQTPTKAERHAHKEEVLACVVRELKAGFGVTAVSSVCRCRRTFVTSVKKGMK